VEPRTLSLCASDTERQFLLKPDDLFMTVDSDSDLGSSKTTDAQYRMIF
jgi:hypothetical protein